MSIAAEISEDDYRIAGSATGYAEPGEFGPLPCGCCLVVTEFDPVGPRLLFVMMRKDAAPHEHTADELNGLLP